MAELSGAASGRAARFAALEKMLKRREAMKRGMQGKAERSDKTQKKGLARTGEEFDVEKLIKRAR